MPRSQSPAILTVCLSATLLLGCGDPPSDDPTARCGWSAPHRLFAHDFAAGGLTFGPSTDIRGRRHDLPGDLFYSADTLYSSGYCGEDLAPFPGDGLDHLHPGLAIDCEAGVVLRGDSDDTLVPVHEGVSCDWLVTPEGILGATRGSDDQVGVIPLRLIDFRAPELPVVALSDEPVLPRAGYVGPRGAVIAPRNDRLQSNHYSSPYLMLTTGGAVLHVDRDTWTTTPVLQDVAELIPAPDGRSFAYRPRLADDTPGDMRVRVLATASEFTVATADEIIAWVRPWWSVDSSLFAVTIGDPGLSRDRVVSLPSGTPAVTQPGNQIVRELPDGGLWLSESAGQAREYHWEPFDDVRRLLYAHTTPGPLLLGYGRAGVDGLEIVVPDQPSVSPFFARSATLLLAPYEGAPPTLLAADIHPWYQRLADGRVVTTRSSAPDYEPGDASDLLLIDGADERTIDHDVIALAPPSGRDYESSGYFRVVGDLLIYAVRDGDRSGVWAVNLSRL